MDPMLLMQGHQHPDLNQTILLCVTVAAVGKSDSPTLQVVRLLLLQLPLLLEGALQLLLLQPLLVVVVPLLLLLLLPQQV